ncbi:MAG: tetratricopeptide repeat-containing protein [Rhodothermales bacterium]|nr:tetratricopeptide repeat-containing protein [Rhodothermales bacterium]
MPIPHSAFIVRPYEVKGDIDFERVERELIRPAMENANIRGGPAKDVLVAGNIQRDMFLSLLTADIVIADISIHSPNVFYELGIRHVLRPRHTFMIYAADKGEKHPFDIQQERYLAYDSRNPQECVDLLSRALADSLRSERPDSPVFAWLQGLREQDVALFLRSIEDKDFARQVAKHEGAAKEKSTEEPEKKRHMADLRLLADDVVGRPWAVVGLKRIGEILFQLKHLAFARAVWERVLERFPDDEDALDRLSTLYNRAGLIAESDRLVQRLLKLRDDSNPQFAEAMALHGRNVKQLWQSDWAEKPADGTREDTTRLAIESPRLFDAFRAYDEAFRGNLNHYYSGVNALALAVIIDQLAGRHPEPWERGYPSKQAADSALRVISERIGQLEQLVRASLESSIYLKRQRGGVGTEIRKPEWEEATEAEVICLTSPDPDRVARAYKKAAQASPFVVDSMRRQLRLYQALGVQAAQVDAALRELGEAASSEDHVTHVILFTGHMIDSLDRTVARFPPACEEAVRREIGLAVEAIVQWMEAARGAGTRLTVRGLAGGACGGDLLFHEVCRERGIATDFYSPFPPTDFLPGSVSFAGDAWVRRFYTLYDTTPREGRPVLQDTKAMPYWVDGGKGYDIWVRNNRWMLYHALALGGGQATLLALWDRQPGDGVGGTEGMVRDAERNGMEVRVMDMEVIRASLS